MSKLSLACALFEIDNTDLEPSIEQVDEKTPLCTRYGFPSHLKVLLTPFLHGRHMQLSGLNSIDGSYS